MGHSGSVRVYLGFIGNLQPLSLGSVWIQDCSAVTNAFYEPMWGLWFRIWSCSGFQGLLSVLGLRF